MIKNKNSIICIPGKFGFRFKDVARWEIIDIPTSGKPEIKRLIKIWFYNSTEHLQIQFDSKQDREDIEQMLIHHFLHGHLEPLKITAPDRWNEYDNYVKVSAENGTTPLNFFQWLRTQENCTNKE